MRLHAELRNALHAEVLLRRDVDYIVRDGRIELVDELTGRVAENRLWPDGLQASLEAKEGLLLQPEGRILDSLTIQLFLQRYPRLCGMTGTARPAAEAGAPGAVTISTNMAGRGTDIRLGGSGERGRDEVVARGGLYVIGTNRHESRRIDDQLRGRAGRQGDPGASRFFISLEDDLMQRYGIERLLPAKFFQQPVGDHPAVQREVARVQRIVEGQYADLRKRLLAASRVLERQRSVLQEWRQEILEGRGESLLAEASPRWQRLLSDHDEDFLRRIESRIALIVLDRCWSQHITDLQALRDELYVVQLDGRDPYTEFCRISGEAFEALHEQIEKGIVEAFERIRITRTGVDWESEGLLGPSSTWTYLVNDNVFSSNTFLTLGVRASFGLWAVLVAWPLLLVWGAAQHWRRWRQRGRPAH